MPLHEDSADAHLARMRVRVRVSVRVWVRVGLCTVPARRRERHD